MDISGEKRARYTKEYFNSSLKFKCCMLKARSVIGAIKDGFKKAKA